MKWRRKKTTRKLTDPKYNQEPPAGSTVLNFEPGMTLKEQVEEVTSKVPAAEPAPEAKTEVKAKAKATKATPEIAPDVGQLLSLDVFLWDNLEAKEGEKKVTTLDIVEKYQAAAKAAGESALPKFQVQRMLRALVLKNFPSAVYSNSTPDGFKGVVWKSFLEESAAKRAETAAKRSGTTVSEGTKAQLKSR